MRLSILLIFQFVSTWQKTLKLYGADGSYVGNDDGVAMKISTKSA